MRGADRWLASAHRGRSPRSLGGTWACPMDWNKARNQIRANITVGSDLNTQESSYRSVLEVDALIDSARYAYQGERGFIISIGDSTNVKIPWSMLKECYPQLSVSHGYMGAFFRKRFPLQAKDHPCHVHVVGQIFMVAGLATRKDKRTYVAA